ncbi:MAG TPA: MFS transporter, partial [Pirellulales bacterium]|nr:MFS transporter [Pirellulales bacterium]
MSVIDAAASDDRSNPEPSRRSDATHVHYQVLAVGCSFTFLTYVHRQAFVGGTPEIQAALGLTTAQMGYISSTFLVAYGLFQVPCGLVGDRLGARNLLTILVLAWSAVTALTALAGVIPASVIGPFAVLVSARFLFGAFQSGAFPVWTRAMTDWIPLSERATGQGIAWMFSRLGGALGPLLFLVLFQAFDTWTTPLWILSLLGL